MERKQISWFEGGMRSHPRKSALFKKNAIMSYLKSRMVKGSCLRELPFGSLQWKKLAVVMQRRKSGGWRQKRGDYGIRSLKTWWKVGLEHK